MNIHTGKSTLKVKRNSTRMVLIMDTRLRTPYILLDVVEAFVGAHLTSL